MLKTHLHKTIIHKIKNKFIYDQKRLYVFGLNIVNTVILGIIFPKGYDKKF